MEGLLSLIRSGITVVTLLDGQSYSSQSVQNDWTRLMLSVVLMARAHEESQTKSDRVSKAWGAKRDRCTKTSEALTGRCVAWCRVVGDVRAGAKMELIPERAEVIRRIFEMTADGFGQRKVAGILNREGVPSWQNGNGWRSSYIAKILGSRAVLGYNQPHVKPRKDVRRTPEGPEIAGYYQPAVDEELFYRAIAARTGRRGKGGPKGKGVANLFTHLCKCESCGRTMNFVNKGAPPKGGKYLVCDSLTRGMPCESPASWRYDKAERIILANVVRLDLDAVLGKGESALDNALGRSIAIKGQLEAAERMRDRLLETLGDVDDPAVTARIRAAAQTVARLKSEAKDAEKETKTLEYSGGLGDRLAQVAELSQKMASSEGDELEAIRVRLQQELKACLVLLRFTPNNILADYRYDKSRKRNAFEWLNGVPLIQDADAAAHYEAEIEAQADEDAARVKVPQGGQLRRKSSLPASRPAPSS
jgi:hypothetical protein